MSNAQSRPENFLPLQSHNVSGQAVEMYHLSHDLRGPLNSILGFTELLYEGIEGPVNEIQLEDLAAIRQSAKNLLRLINTIVDLSKVDAGLITFNQDAIQLQEILQQIIIETQPEDSRVETMLDIPPSLPPVEGDSERVRQIIANVVSFAQSHKNSSLIMITAGSDATHITLSVVATGVFFSEKKEAELFELTVSVDSVGRSGLGAGGLMLPLAKQLAERQQGQLWAKRSNSGTEFILKLPRYNEQNG